MLFSTAEITTTNHYSGPSKKRCIFIQNTFRIYVWTYLFLSLQFKRSADGARFLKAKDWAMEEEVVFDSSIHTKFFTFIQCYNKSAALITSIEKAEKIYRPKFPVSHYENCERLVILFRISIDHDITYFNYKKISGKKETGRIISRRCQDSHCCRFSRSCRFN